jgi:hypothetical protein
MNNQKDKVIFITKSTGARKAPLQFSYFTLVCVGASSARPQISDLNKFLPVRQTGQVIFLCV